MDKDIITLDELLAIDQQKILETCSNPICSELLHSFLSIAEAGSDTAMILAKLCAVRFSQNESKNPFQGYSILDDKAGFLPRDFPDEIFVTLKDFYPKVIIPDLKARIADVIWTAKPNKLNTVDDAYSAIDAYIESAKKLIGLDINEHEYDIINRIKRALQLSKLFKRDNQRPDLYARVRQFIIDEINKNLGGFYTLDLLSLLADVAWDNDVISTDIIIHFAKLYFSEEEFNLSIEYYMLARDIASSQQNKEKEDILWEDISNVYYEWSKKPANKGLAASYVLKAIECLDKVSNKREKRDELHNVLRGYQKESLHQMKHFTVGPIDLFEIQNKARNSISGLDLTDTIMKFSCGLVELPKISLIKKEANKEMDNNIFTRIFNTEYSDHEGMKIANIQGVLDNDEIDESGKLWSIMMKHLNFNHSINVQGIIVPALDEMSMKFNINEQAIKNIFMNNPFIPLGHELFYLKGISAGFNGDFLTANHLLIPQIENSLRYILKMSGKEPTSLHTNGSQERNGLKYVLEEPNIINLLGENIVFNLKAVLIDELYGGIRHSLSHGYISANTFYSYRAVYTWWLILHILMIPYCDLSE